MDEFNQAERRLPALTSAQKEVLDYLQKIEGEDFKFGDWYLGAIHALGALDNPDRLSHAANSLREILEKIPRVLPGVAGFQAHSVLSGMRDKIRKRYEQDKAHYGESWSGAINSSLAQTLRLIGEYLDLSKRSKNKETIVSVWDIYGPPASQDTLGEIHKIHHNLCKDLEGYKHHQITDADKFYLLVEHFESLIILLMKHTTAKDHYEIRKILEKSQSPSRDDFRRIEDLITQKANFDFFFHAVESPQWLRLLYEAGYFIEPLEANPARESQVTFPAPLLISYLSKIANDEPEMVVTIIREMNDTDDWFAMDEIAKIALKIQDVKFSLLLEEKVYSYLDSESFLQHSHVPKLLLKWAVGGDKALASALRLARSLVAFHMPDRKDIEPHLIEPRSKFSNYKYAEILSNGIRPLADIAPLETAMILINTVADMVQLRYSEERQGEDQWKDNSIIWCPLVDKPAGGYFSPREGLVNTLTYACEQVYTRQPDAISNLDESLREKHWTVFNRIRYHLYANHLSGQTRLSIRECINEHRYCDKYMHDEFRRMIRLACEHFQENLLTGNEREKIFSSILDGPNEADFRRRQSEMSRPSSEEAFTEYRRYFHLVQLKPFESVLFGRYKEYYLELLREMGDQLVDEDEFSRRAVNNRGAQLISHQSPKSVEQLTAMSDENLIAFLNEWEWEEPRFETGGLWVEVDFIGLKYAFQQVITEQPERFANWGERWKKIRRPIYLTCVMSVASEFVRGGSVKHLSAWFDVCDLILTYLDRLPGTNEGYSNVSAERPHWRSTQSAALDFIDVCLNNASNASATWRSRIRDILTKSCERYDRRLDENRLIPVGGDSLLNEAVNTTRGHALQSLVRYGSWVQEHAGKSEALPEIFEILDARFAGKPALTAPEYALLGRDFVSLYRLNPEWTKRKVQQIFPRSNPAYWQAAFNTYLHYDCCHRESFDIIKPEFEHALNNIDTMQVSEEFRLTFVDILGKSILDYYFWGQFSLKREGSLLKKYYQMTDAKSWASLFDHAGHHLKNAGKSINSDIKERFLDFFESRFEVGCQEELKEFTYWLEAECLDVEWRLEQYSRILDKVKISEIGMLSQSGELRKLLDANPNLVDLVMVCFEKLVKWASRENNYINPEAAKVILRHGMNSKTLRIKRVSIETRDRLLQLGHFDL